MRKIILNLILIVLLTSCSAVKLGYSFGDWLIKREILSHVKLYKDQQGELEKVLDRYMLWHKEEMLPEYLTSINQIKKLINKESSAININEIQTIAMTSLLKTVSKLGQDVAPVIGSINDKQLDRSRLLIARSFDKKIKKMKSYKSKDIYVLWEDNSLDWFGAINLDQKKWLEDNKNKLFTQKDSLTKLAIAGQRQKDFLEIFDSKDAKDRINKQVEFWIKFEKNYKVFEGRPHMEILLLNYIKLIDKVQKEKIIMKLESYESKIKMLIAL
jgi:hypothetical protein